MKTTDFPPKQIQKTEVLNTVNSYLTTTKFQNNLNTIILTTLSNKKTSSMTRNEIEEKILEFDYIKEVENEILSNLYKKYSFNKQDIDELKANNNKNKEKIINNQIKTKNILPPIIQNKNMDNDKLLNYLIDDVLSNTQNQVSFETFINDLRGFNTSMIVEHPKIINLINKIEKYLIQLAHQDIYEVEIITQLYQKLSETNNYNFLIKLSIGYMEYIHILTKRFYKSTFDITKFYKLFFNLKIINNIILKLYGDLLISRKIPSENVTKMTELFLKIILINYDSSNSIYIVDKSHNDNSQIEMDVNQDNKENKINIKYNEEFGIPTNYMLLLLFCTNYDLPSIKVLFRCTSFRIEMIKYFYLFKYLPFINYSLSIESFHKKYCFLWKHFNILDQLEMKQKVTKKFLLFSWFYIKISFLGFILRYKLLRETFFNHFKLQSENFTCFNLFQNLVTFLTRIMLLMDCNNEEDRTSLLDGYEMLIFEDWQYEYLIYLCKEVICDFILYCYDNACKEKKREYFIKITEKTVMVNNIILSSIFDDINLAFNENK